MLITENTANRIYDLLVEICDAPDEQRLLFVAYVTREKPRMEWRFSGLLGFGGKVYINRTEIMVRCYPEDETPARREAIDKANKLLAEIYAEVAR